MQLMGDQNDVYVVLSMSNNWKNKTSTLWDAGADASWVIDPYDQDWTKLTTVEDLDNETLSIEVYDDNKLSAHVIIGTRKVALAAVVALWKHDPQSTLDSEVEIYDEKGVVTGNVKITFSMSIAEPQKS